jgi:RNA polymerase sigma factor (sigma-70 family)
VSKEERDKLIVDNMRLVYYLIQRYYPGNLANEDVKQEGMLGLIKAANNWDESKSKFSSYASLCILGQIRWYFKREKKHSHVVSLNNVSKTTDGEEVEYGDTLVGKSDVDLTMAYFDEFYESLDEIDKEILELSVDHNQKEIGEVVGLCQTAVYTRKQNLRKKWRKFNGND